MNSSVVAFKASHAPVPKGVPSAAPSAAALAEALRTLHAEADAILNLATRLQDGSGFAEVVNLFANLKPHNGKVIVTGVGKSGHIGGKVAATLASTGTPAFFVHPAEALHGDLGMITAADAVLALSHSGESRELAAVMAYCARFKIPLVAITGQPESSLGRAATYILNTHVTREACPLNLAPTTSTTVALALADALAVGLMAARGFGKADFAAFHPGGRLGAQLLRVHEVMLTGTPAAALPVLPATAPLRQVLVTLTQCNQGSVAFTDDEGRLAGIFTDGDLKRLLLNAPPANLFDLPAHVIMSRSPKTISPEELAVNGVAQLQQQHIKDLWVVNAISRPIGLFRLETCLALGVV